MSIDAEVEPIGNGDHDLKIVDGDLVIVGETAETHQRAVVQRIRYAVGTFFGECPFDRSEGFPWVESVFGVQPVDGVGALLQDHISKVEGVEGLDEPPVIELDKESGRLLIQVKAKGSEFEIPVDTEVTPP